MTKSGSEEESRRISNASHSVLDGMTGSVLSFAALARILGEPDTQKLALIVEKLTSKDVRLLKPVYYFDDQEYGLLELPDVAVNFYLINGLFSHPVTNAEIGSDDIDDHIVIEFEVL